MYEFVNQNAAKLLSTRETSCLQALATGDSNRDISSKLNIALPTVALHLANARRKLGAVSREHAVALAVAKGLIDVNART